MADALEKELDRMLATCSHVGCTEAPFKEGERCAEHEIAFWKSRYEAIAAPKPKSAKPKKSFMDRYRTYEGEPGNEDQWRKQAEAVVMAVQDGTSHLDVLGLTQLPSSMADLKKARNKAALKAHPDRGGTDEQQAAINKAFDALAALLETREVKPMSTEGLSPVTRPMRAFTLEPEHLHSIRYPVLASFKYDGIRASKFGGKSRTKSFKPIPNKFIREWMEQNLPEGMETEACVHGKDFNDVSSAVMSRDGEPDFVLYAFDYCPSDTSTPIEKRIEQCREAVAKVNSPRLVFVEHKLVNNLEELLAFEDECLRAGAEGLILHAPGGGYKCGECSLTDQWTMKFKRYVDSEGVIIGFTELMRNTNEKKVGEDGKSKRGHSKAGKVPAGTLGTMLLRDDAKGWEVEVGGGKKFTAKLRQWLWDNRSTLMGATVKYRYQPRGMKDVARFPGWLGPDDGAAWLGIRSVFDMEPKAGIESFADADAQDEGDE